MLIYLSIIETQEDRDKFTQVYEQYRFLMLHVAMSILKEQYLAEDAVHNAFLKIIENLDKISDTSCSKTKSFIVTITKNKAIDIWRKRSVIQESPLEHEDYLIPTNDADLLDEVISKQGYEALISRVAKLDEKYKIVLELKYIQTYSDVEISKLLDITPKNVNIRIHRAKAMLRETLSKDGENID